MEFFKCCTRPNHDNSTESYEDEQKRKNELLNNSNNSMNMTNLKKLKEEEEKFNNQLLWEESLLSDYEKNCAELKITKQGIIKYFDYIEKLDEWTLLYEKENLKLNYRKCGSPFCNKIYLGQSTYKIDRKEIKCHVTIEKLRDLMYSIENRMKWDKNVKSIAKFSNNEYGFKTNNVSYIINTKFYSPFKLFMSDRESMNKRIEFIHEGVFYDYSSGIDDDILPEDLKTKRDFVRVFTYVGLFTMSIDEEFIYFKSFNQTDVKMMLPEWFFNMMLPYTVMDYYKKMEKIIKDIDNL